jgi:hypothetical protein
MKTTTSESWVLEVGLHRSTVLLGLAGALLLGPASRASTLYVDANSANPTPPYATWATAARVIQDAVDASVGGDEIVVTNGLYATGGRLVSGTLPNRVAVDRPINMHSVNGPQFTIIQGYQLPETTNGDGAIRCVYLTNGASLSGFTLSLGATRGASLGRFADQRGGGVYCGSAGSTVSNCVLAGNSAAAEGGGVFRGTVNNCSLNGNLARYGGGASRCTLNDCTLTNNLGGHGGGATYSTLNNCTVFGNAAGDGGGVAFCSLSSCAVVGNSAAYGGGSFLGTFKNCTVVGNSAVRGGGGVYDADDRTGSNTFLANTIVYFNTANSGSNLLNVLNLDHCCVAPLPSGFKGTGSITNDPLFIDRVGGNLRLQAGSPCINAGNNAYATTATDLDGNPRVVNGTVDIGAYEFQGPSGLTGFHAWLAQYGLPTDSSADYVDSGGDGMNNWQKWIAGTDPTNALSALRLLTPTTDGTNITVSWHSVVGIGYFLQRSTNLGIPGSFIPLATNLLGQAGTTSFTDTNAAGSEQLYYRVGVGN